MKRRCRTWVAAGAAAALLAACGGGGGPDDAPAAAPGPLEAVPAGANESAAGLVGYLGTLGSANEQAEGVEPLALDGFEPRRPEDTEPEPVT